MIFLIRPVPYLDVQLEAGMVIATYYENAPTWVLQLFIATNKLV
jgi:hypothetical protein